MMGPVHASTEELKARLEEAIDSLSKQAEAAGPVPRSLQKTIASMSSGLTMLDTASLKAFFQKPKEYPIVHPILQLLMQDDFDQLSKTFGHAVAKAAFEKVIRSLGRRQRGRPQEIPMETVVAAKTLRDQGWS